MNFTQLSTYRNVGLKLYQIFVYLVHFFYLLITFLHALRIFVIGTLVETFENLKKHILPIQVILVQRSVKVYREKESLDHLKNATSPEWKKSLLLSTTLLLFER